MAGFETRARGQAERSDIQEAGRDMAQLSRMSPAQRNVEPAGQRQASRLRGIAQRQALTANTAQTLRQSQQMELAAAASERAAQQQRTNDIRRIAQDALQRRGQKFSEGMATARLDLSRRGQEFGEQSARDRLNLSYRQQEQRELDARNRLELDVSKNFTGASAQDFLSRQPQLGGQAQPPIPMGQPAQQGALRPIDESQELQGARGQLSRRQLPEGALEQPQQEPRVRPALAERASKSQKERGAETRELNDLATFEGLPARVGSFNNVPGVWVKDPNTGRQSFVGQKELSSHFGEEFMDLSTMEKNITLPGTQPEAKPQEPAAKPAGARETLARRGATSGLVPRETASSRAKAAKETKQPLPSKTAGFYANMAIHQGVDKTEIYDEEGKLTRKGQAFVDTMDRNRAANPDATDEELTKNASQFSQLRTPRGIKEDRLKELKQQNIAEEGYHEPRYLTNESDQFHTNFEEIKKLEKELGTQPEKKAAPFKFKGDVSDLVTGFKGRGDSSDHTASVARVRSMLGNSEENAGDLLRFYMESTGEKLDTILTPAWLQSAKDDLAKEHGFGRLSDKQLKKAFNADNKDFDKELIDSVAKYYLTGRTFNRQSGAKGFKSELPDRGVVDSVKKLLNESAYLAPDPRVKKLLDRNRKLRK